MNEDSEKNAANAVSRKEVLERIKKRLANEIDEDNDATSSYVSSSVDSEHQPKEEDQII